MKAEEQEGKEREKKEGEISVRFSRTRVCVRAFQPQCCFFAVTSVTQGTEVERQVGENAGKGRKKNHRFLCC